jgi:hypothetical protein
MFTPLFDELSWQFGSLVVSLPQTTVLAVLMSLYSLQYRPGRLCTADQTTFKSHASSPPSLPRLLRPHRLQLLRTVHKLRRIRLRDKPPLIRLLNVILIPLLIRKQNSVFFRLERQLRALHTVARRLPAHQGVLPSVALLKNVPVHPP